jgi:hypothetical protein
VGVASYDLTTADRYIVTAYCPLALLHCLKICYHHPNKYKIVLLGNNYDDNVGNLMISCNF